jgi:hypothetical protein
VLRPFGKSADPEQVSVLQEISVWSGLDGVFPLVDDLAAQAEQIGGFAVDR